MRYFKVARNRERAAVRTATLSEFKEMGQLGYKPNQSHDFQGFALVITPSDCPDTSLQYHSRHWITSFQKIADKLKVT